MLGVLQQNKCRRHHSLYETKQSNNDRATAWQASNHIAQGSALGFVCREIIPPRKGQKHFSPTDKGFALSGRSLLCYPCSPGRCPGLVAHCPFQGRIRRDDGLSKKHHVLTSKNRGCWSRKGLSVEKTPIFDVFRNALNDRWLHRFLSVNGRFTKSEFAKGKVSLHERPCFVV